MRESVVNNPRHHLSIIHGGASTETLPTFFRVRDNLPRREHKRPVVLRVARAWGLPQRFPWKTGQAKRDEGGGVG